MALQMCRASARLPAARCSTSASARVVPAAGMLPARRRAQISARAGPEDASKDSIDGSARSSDDDELSRLSSIKRASSSSPAEPSSSNPVLGALSEAQLITWPKPQKALVDTVLVLSIVTVSGLLLFSLNVGLSAFSDLWYHR